MTGPELVGVLIGIVALALIAASQAGYGRTHKEKE